MSNAALNSLKFLACVKYMESGKIQPQLHDLPNA